MVHFDLMGSFEVNETAGTASDTLLFEAVGMVTVAVAAAVLDIIGVAGTEFTLVDARVREISEVLFVITGIN